MSENKSLIMVFIEWSDDGTLLPVSLEVLNLAHKLAVNGNYRVMSLVMGKNTDQVVAELTHYATDIIYRIDHPGLEFYEPEPYLEVFKNVCKKTEPDVILFGHTLTAIDLAPRVAFESGTELVSDCVDINDESDELLFVKPTYSGNVMAQYSFESSPCMATIRLHSFEPAERGEISACEIFDYDPELEKLTPKIKTHQRFAEEGATAKLSTADIVVAGGRGMGGPGGFEMLQSIADILGGVIGSSRPPCDLGWVAKKTQVGLTGEIVAPSLYIAVGISGSFQHLSGMIDSKTTVAVNQNPDANIFNVADYGVVGDYEDVLPAFKETLLELSKP